MNKKLKIFAVIAIIAGTTFFAGSKIVNGSTGIIPQTAALFQAQLSSGLPANGTSTTLSSNETQLGTTLSNGYYSFIIDQGTPQVEIVEGTLIGDNVINMVRGVDPQNPNVTSSALTYSHSAGAYVQITVYSWLQHVSRILQGLDTEPASLQLGATAFYTSHPTSTASTTIEDKNYIDSAVVSQGVPATNGVPGIQFSATTTQLLNSIATAVYNLQTYFYAVSAGSVASTSRQFSIPLTNASGTLPDSFIGQSASDTYNYSSSSITFGTSTKFSSATSSVISTNSSGTILGISAVSVGNILVASGTQWISATSSAANSYYVSSTVIYNPGNSVAGGTSTSTASTTFNLPYAGRILIIYTGSAVNFNANSSCSDFVTINGTQDGGTMVSALQGSTGVSSIFTSMGFSHISTVILPAGNNSVSVMLSSNANACVYNNSISSMQIEYLGQ